MTIDLVEQNDGEEGLDYNEYKVETGGQGRQRVVVAERDYGVENKATHIEYCRTNGERGDIKCDLLEPSQVVCSWMSARPCSMLSLIVIRAFARVS